MIVDDEFNLKKIIKNDKSAKLLLSELIYDKQLNASKIGQELGMGNYIYEITNLASNKVPSRNKLLTILIYLKTPLPLMNEILQKFGHSKIYVKIPFDAALYWCITNDYDLDQINNYLNEQELPLLF